ncbi:tail tubular protein A [Erwinia phage vB_EamP-L1]|uniref:Tail tubular protein A n=2 Tax=Elunavirus TaxID=2732681 RepID=G0YQ76_9CAUD|nr:tail protein [Erwinia phage vB_EamP-L1]AEJ81503.1 tail tubular protein A [Erwinia phage vB_EamP-L1]QFR42378.1 tail tubular protein A [Pantoea phage vB_PagP-SK1]
MADSFLNPADELDAINDILASIGEAPVLTLGDSANVDVSNAQQILSKVNRMIQSKGWTFNIEEGAVLVPDVNTGLIPYLPSYLRVQGADSPNTYINRQGYVYDTAGLTDVFQGSISVNLTRLREYSEMPQCFRSYIVTKASRQFNMRYFGDTAIESILAEEEAEAYMQCNEYELDYGKFNMLDGDAFVQGILSR